MVESVNMAIEMLNDTEFKPGYKISVWRIIFIFLGKVGRILIKRGLICSKKKAKAW